MLPAGDWLVRASQRLVRCWSLFGGCVHVFHWARTSAMWLYLMEWMSDSQAATGVDSHRRLLHMQNQSQLEPGK